MILRRRYLIAFLMLNVAAGTLGAQNRAGTPGQSEPIPGNYTSDEVKAALERFGKGGGMPDLPPWLMDMLKDQIAKKEGKVDDKQMREAAEMMKRDPALAKQMEELAKKFRNSGGKRPEITPEDRQKFEGLAKQFEQHMPKGGGGGPGVAPNGGIPKAGGPPPDPNMGNPDAAPKTVDPIVPKNGDNPIPRNGGAAPPENPIPPKFDIKPPGQVDPNMSPKDKAAHAAASLWERNVGPLDDTPAVKRALFDLVEGTEDIRDEDGNSFWDQLSKETGDSTSLADLFNSASMGDSWSFSKIDMPSLNWSLSGRDSDIGSGSGSGRESWWQRNFGGNRSPSSSSSSSPRMPSGGSGGFNFNIGGLEGSWLPVVILAALLFGSLLVWWLLKRQQARLAVGFGTGMPGWPIDPYKITTREHVVIAFQYLSVLICGPVAKTWTHNTIAGALADLATTHGETAVLLARLYELARYAPLDEPLTTSELAEARRLVCTLAGLEHE